MQKFLVLIFLVASIYAADDPLDAPQSDPLVDPPNDPLDNYVLPNGLETTDSSYPLLFGTLAPEYFLYRSAHNKFYLTADVSSMISEFSKITNKQYFTILEGTQNPDDKVWLSSYAHALSLLRSDYSKMGLPIFTPTLDISFIFPSGGTYVYPSLSEDSSDQQPDETGSATENGTDQESSETGSVSENGTDQESSETGSVTEISGSNTTASVSSISKKESSSKESSSKLSSSGTSSGSKAAAATMYIAPFGAMVGVIGVALL